MSTRLLHGDCREVLKTLPSESVHCVVTSPPYFGLRDYGTGQWEGGEAGCDHSTARSRGDDIKPGDKQGTSAGSRPNTQRICACGARRTDSQIGLEATPDAYAAEIVAVFREVRRVLRNDGTAWINLGDSYAANGNKQLGRNDAGRDFTGGGGNRLGTGNPGLQGPVRIASGLKPKDLIGIPWLVAFALRADGWYLRSEIIWAKSNPMPESVRDRPTKAHEQIFLLSKSARYHYDADAIREDGCAAIDLPRRHGGGETVQAKGVGGYRVGGTDFRNKRSVWEVATHSFSEAHFATFPPALIEPCILAGCPAKACATCGKPWVREVERTPATVYSPASDYGNGAGRNDGGRSCLVGASSITLGFSPSCSCNAATVPGTVLDPFSGAGTTGLVADRLGRNAVLIELNASYADMSHRRIVDDLPLFAEVVAA